MKREIFIFSFCLILLSIACSNNKEIEFVSEKEVDERKGYDSLAIAYNNKSFELNPIILPKNIPQAIRYLDTAIVIDPSYTIAYHNKLILLTYSDSVAARDFYLEMDSKYPELPFDQFTMGLTSEFYGLSNRAISYYSDWLKNLNSIKTDTMNNTEEIFHIDNLITANLALGRMGTVDSLVNLVGTAFTYEFRELSYFYNLEEISREDFFGGLLVNQSNVEITE